MQHPNKCTPLCHSHIPLVLVLVLGGGSFCCTVDAAACPSHCSDSDRKEIMTHVTEISSALNIARGKLRKQAGPAAD
eukprot:150449-Prorocentrum_minimum.AAC.1